jgi:hypothetical protein
MIMASYSSVAFSTASGLAVAGGATVSVRKESDGALAAIYSDSAGSGPLANPTTADSDGRFEFYAAGIQEGYEITVTDGAESYTLHNVAIGNAAQLDATDFVATFMSTVDSEAEAKTYLGITDPVRTGEVVFWPGLQLPDNALNADGSAVSRTTYADLFAELVQSGTITMTIASPCVVTYTAHGLLDNMPIKFSTTGALPTGLVAGQTYWIKSKTTNTFELADTPGGTSINTSGSQSGVHTGICAPWGDGDGSTTFNLPNYIDRSPIGMGTETTTESFLAASVNTGTNIITIPGNSNKWVTGMAVVLSTSGGAPAGLTAGSTYYVVRQSATTISLASSLANAQNGTSIDITSQGTGTHTITHTRPTRGLGEKGGEDTHATSSTEQLAHVHNIGDIIQRNGADQPFDHNSGVATAADGFWSTRNTDNMGGNVAMNNMSPWAGGRWIIFYA